MNVVTLDTFKKFIKNPEMRELNGYVQLVNGTKYLRCVKATIASSEPNDHIVEAVYGSSINVIKTDNFYAPITAEDMKLLALVVDSKYICVKGTEAYQKLSMVLNSSLKRNFDSVRESKIDDDIYYAMLLLTCNLQKAQKTVFEQSATISMFDAAKINAYINGEISVQGEDNTFSVSVEFDDGMQMDIKCCGSNDGPSWTEAVLFAPSYMGGCEVAMTDVDDVFVKIWEIEYEGCIYRAIIRVDSQKGEG